MQHIKDLLTINKPKHRSERAEVLSYLIAGLDKEYEPRVVAIKTSHLKVQDLRYLLSICKQSNNFSKTFFGALKVK